MQTTTTCICQCGRTVPVILNGQGALVLLELLEFDRMRAILMASSQHSGVPVPHENADRFIDDGASLYQLILQTLHGERRWSKEDERQLKRWLKFSRKSRKKLHRQTDGIIRKEKSIPPRDDDRPLINFVHPEQSFSGSLSEDGAVHSPAQAEGLGDSPPRPAEIVTCFASDPDVLYAEAAVVIRAQPQDQAPGKYVTLSLSFTDDDRVDVFMSGDVGCLVKDVEGFDVLSEAIEEAELWVVDDPQEFEFEYLPGIYQAAVWAHLLGIEVESAPGWYGWILPTSEKGLAPVRDFPPRLEPTELSPVPGEVSFALLPDGVATEMRRSVVPPHMGQT